MVLYASAAVSPSLYLRPDVGAHEVVTLLTGPRGAISIPQLQATRGFPPVIWPQHCCGSSKKTHRRGSGATHTFRRNDARTQPRRTALTRISLAFPAVSNGERENVSLLLKSHSDLRPCNAHTNTLVSPHRPAADQCAEAATFNVEKVKTVDM